VIKRRLPWTSFPCDVAGCVVAFASVTEDTKLELRHPPIVEAVLDIDCDLPPAQDLVA